jgi:hypothetical protein
VSEFEADGSRSRMVLGVCEAEGDKGLVEDPVPQLLEFLRRVVEFSSSRILMCDIVGCGN